MTPTLSANTQAILLLTAPLLAGRGGFSADLLSPGEYNRLARHLREMQRQPADLLGSDSTELLRACQSIVEDGRLQRLIGRGFLLSQVIEHWQARAIWVVSRADAEYPRRLKVRLREDAPAVLYGCGNIALLDTGGLAVVGSRHIDGAVLDYTVAIGRFAARARRTLVSGGAKGVDQAAMRGALEAGGKVSGVLAESLEETAMNRAHRNVLIDGQLVLISQCDPRASFNVGNAMKRNKLIYALADAALVVNSDLNKGGTWAGAVEQLDKFRLVPVFVRSTGEASAGLAALQKKGALSWPNPQDVNTFEAVFQATIPNASDTTQLGLSPVASDAATALAKFRVGSRDDIPVTHGVAATESALRAPGVDFSEDQSIQTTGESASRPLQPDVTLDSGARQPYSRPADALFNAVREAVQGLLKVPMTPAEVASALDVSVPQARVWLQRLVKEGMLDTRSKPPRYVVKLQASLLGNEEHSQRLHRTGTRRR